jgi:type II secretory pathway pseudopilin PulG
MRIYKQRGITFVEITVVFAVLGTASAVIVPRYLASGHKTRIAVVSGFAGSVKSAASLARGLSLATSNSDSIALEGTMVTLLNHYPDPTGNGIASAIGTSGRVKSDFTFTPGLGARKPAIWTKNGAPVPAECAVTYTAAAEGATPSVQVLTMGC